MRHPAAARARRDRARARAVPTDSVPLSRPYLGLTPWANLCRRFGARVSKGSGAVELSTCGRHRRKRVLPKRQRYVRLTELTWSCAAERCNQTFCSNWSRTAAPHALRRIQTSRPGGSSDLGFPATHAVFPYLLIPSAELRATDSELKPGLPSLRQPSSPCPSAGPEDER